MIYRTLGNTGIQVSLITLGTMTYGEQNSQSDAFEQMDYAYEQGVNCFDVAEMYPMPPNESSYGDSEVMVGNWLKSRGLRDKVVVSTKIAGNGQLHSGFKYIRGGPRLSAEQIRRAVDASLVRLQTDVIDLYQLHWPERRTNFFGQLGYEYPDAGDAASEDAYSLEESISAMADLVTAGKVRCVGVSNESPWGLMEACRIADKFQLPRIASIQNPYNLLNRTFEIGLAEICYRERISLLAYSPLAFGVLTGKYRRGARPANARLTLYTRFSRYNNDNAQRATDSYYELAQAVGLSLTELSMAFVNRQPFVAMNIIGATTMAQLRENIATVNVSLSAELLAEIETIHKQNANPAP
ncbi:MAG: aryl-alcohol dehydrogenase-like predicted oxidoreductase [Pseudohongiellaceae bacterium]|jgi:aryl-alcohol dehydrogenase-like predicted oxidoreductase